MRPPFGRVGVGYGPGDLGAAYRHLWQQVCVTFDSLVFLRVALGGLLASCMSVEASEPRAFARVAEAIRRSPALYEDLHTLCDRIGPRLAGSQGMRDALEWALQAFRDAGIDEVRLEAVPIPVRWEEGETRLDVLAPVAIRVRAAATALSPSVPHSVEAEVVDGGSGSPGAITRRAARYRGKILLVSLDAASSFDDLAVEQRDAMVAVREAAEVEALAVLLLSTRPNQLLYRHINNVTGRIDPIPSALLAREDGLRLVRLLRDGAEVRARLEMRNRIGGAYETANIVADIAGSDMESEIVLLGAHLDSWDLGTGCQDNAVNAALVLQVARAIREAGVHPRRTLRFVLFGGEELGLFGSLAYVVRHRSELDSHVAAIVHDMGAGRLLGYSVGGREDLLARLETVLDPVDRSHALRHTREAYFLSDNFTFVLQGVPTLFAVQDTSDFFLTYHSEADTLDKVQIDTVREATVVAAAAALGIADFEPRFGDRLEEKMVTSWLKRAGLVRHLRFLGVWQTWRPQSILESSSVATPRQAP